MWTNVNVKLPKDGAEKLVTVQDMYGHRHVTVCAFAKGKQPGWLTGTVIAWAPLPRAWRGK
jgi:hypothetical protein